MGALLYIYRGVVLLLSLCSSSRRKATFERWKKTKRHKLIYEMGYGVIGLAVLVGISFIVLLLLIHAVEKSFRSS
jgi:membrane-anchored glycerophosphoryl diester phosphodiesterase (GDPDase)